MDLKAGQEQFRHQRFVADAGCLQDSLADLPDTPDQADPCGAVPDHTRAIIHFDIDCFYAQAEEVRNPKLRGRPLGVTQKYLIVTCNYEARQRGVTKLMGITDALAKCPELALVRLVVLGLLAYELLAVRRRD